MSNTPQTNIISNGSKWAGESPDDLATLLDVLANEPLDPRFEKYGNFIHDYSDPAIPAGHIRFWGNFLTVSHVFSIDTNDPDVIEQLTKAIRANQQRADYIAERMNGPWIAPRQAS